MQPYTGEDTAALATSTHTHTHRCSPRESKMLFLGAALPRSQVKRGCSWTSFLLCVCVCVIGCLIPKGGRPRRPVEESISRSLPVLDDVFSLRPPFSLSSHPFPTSSKLSDARVLPLVLVPFSLFPAVFVALWSPYTHLAVLPSTWCRARVVWPLRCFFSFYFDGCVLSSSHVTLPGAFCCCFFPFPHWIPQVRVTTCGRVVRRRRRR